MTDADLIVIGSGPAGMTAARAYVEAGGPGRVLVLSSDIDAPYERPPLSKDVLADEAPVEGIALDPSPLPPAIELRLGQTVTSLDLDGSAVACGDHRLTYRRLVIAVGSRVRGLPDADDDAEVFTLRSLDDARRLDLAAQHARSVLVIGSGFIGCEAAASLARRGKQVTVVTPEDSPQRGRLGPAVSALIAGWLAELGVTVRTGVQVTSIRAPRTVHLDDGTTIAPDLILLAVGVQAAADIFDGSGLAVHNGTVVADPQLQAAPDVWVAGDAARATHGITGTTLTVEHWGDALAMGELAGSNAAQPDHQRAWESVPGFWSEIGEHTLKHAAWGGGYSEERVDECPGRLTVWYGDDAGRLVGVLTYNADDDYERGEQLLAQQVTLEYAANGGQP